MKKEKKYAGADERTPSRAQYFSWINNTNEGSTEKQTLINLDYFAYLKRCYNMQLDIYAWDAGNLDGAANTYQTMDSPKIKAQYPNGYAPIVEAAEKIGCRMGVWGGADGFGDTDESAEERIEQMVSLARDYNFSLFKFDTVCSQFDPAHEKHFIKMMQNCRKYSPDLILLNHRIPLSPEAEKYATTFLFGGAETYVDVHMANQITAPHHRAFIMDRGQTPDMARLTEDHGVCISSAIDFFEDDLIIQAFSRNLILAPEIYGNPWLMRDFEQARLARIFNLHRRYRDILVDGMIMPEGKNYPDGTVVRGDLSRRFIVTGNMNWKEKVMNVSLNLSIGLAPCDKVTVIIHHPYEKFVGEFDWGETVEIPLESFRASLVEVCDSKIADDMPRGCEYEVLHESEDGKIDKIKIVSSNGNTTVNGKPLDVPAFDNTLGAPKALSELDADTFAPMPENADQLLEVAMFAQDHDSLEIRSLRRSGETAIPEVKAARDVFFDQKTYKLRGCESRFAFDGNDDTFFDGTSKVFHGDYGYRMDGGCLRVDFGAEYEADSIYFEYFDSDAVESGYWASSTKQTLTPICDYSTDLKNWTETYIDEVHTIRRQDQEVVFGIIHNIKTYSGSRKYVTYPINDKIRYFRMPCPLDHIHKIALIKDGKEIELFDPRVNNLLPAGRKVDHCKELDTFINACDYTEGCYLAVGLEGYHGAEGAYAVIECDKKIYGAPDRSPSYKTNAWEYITAAGSAVDHHYTFYFPITKDMCDKNIKVTVLGMNNDLTDYGIRCFLCQANNEPEGIVVDLK